MVFAILIAPAFIVTAARVRHPLAWAWALGVALNALAVAASYQFDLPTGFTVVFVNAAAALTAGIAAAFRQTRPDVVR
ncbi:MAG: metal ABC transporter permease [Nitrospinae bacterium]|nr:metal ABC transporter permease [Nitrospinota bacterium]